MLLLFGDTKQSVEKNKDLLTMNKKAEPLTEGLAKNWLTNRSINFYFAIQLLLLV
jgi:hypothetical protein